MLGQGKTVLSASFSLLLCLNGGELRFERYCRVEQALLMTIAESYIQGVSTRKMEELVKNFGLNRLSASEVSRLCKILDERVEEFLKRPIEAKIRYLLVDATYFKVRCGVQYKNRALLVVGGIREDGLREILGASIAESEDSGYWLGVTEIEDLKKEISKHVRTVLGPVAYPDKV